MSICWFCLAFYIFPCFLDRHDRVMMLSVFWHLCCHFSFYLACFSGSLLWFSSFLKMFLWDRGEQVVPALSARVRGGQTNTRKQSLFQSRLRSSGVRDRDVRILASPFHRPASISPEVTESNAALKACVPLHIPFCFTGDEFGRFGFN